MLTEEERLQAADVLMEAERTRKPALQLSKTFPNIEVEDSYAIQSEVTRRKIAGDAS